ncbi:hypothetical protein MBLL_00756 (plasmid) [Methylobacterium bullatum]|jgi:hypothetical protein|uniref:Uncharacterized protein n=1 Tax=Methylobacterium bullatum TaxID=570505 RepID=A0A679JFR8_9HYPH|nr:hypothetical protein MBLL_00756 [Methylobacterium bullatum]
MVRRYDSDVSSFVNRPDSVCWDEEAVCLPMQMLCLPENPVFGQKDTYVLMMGMR